MNTPPVVPGDGNPNAPHIYIIVLNYRNWQDTIECLESVLGLDYHKFTILVVDNDSQNESMERLTGWARDYTGPRGRLPFRFFHLRDLPPAIDGAQLPPLVFIQNDRNAGFAGGNNVAIRLVAGNEGYIWLLNPDMVVEPGSLRELIRFAADKPENRIIGSVVRYWSDREKIHYYGGGRIRFGSATVKLVVSPEDIPRLDYISGGALFTKAANFRDLGLLPEQYFLYWEETDWCFRARNAGYQFAVCMTAVCYDKGGTTIGRGYLADFYYTRNGLLFVSKYKRGKIAGALLLVSARLMKRALAGQWSRCKGMWNGITAFLKKSAV